MSAGDLSKEIVPGDELPNGRTLVAIRLMARQQPSWAGDLYAVLALTNNNPRDPYAVWTLVRAPDGSCDPYCYSGSYLSDFESAVAEWRDRRPPA